MTAHRVLLCVLMAVSALTSAFVAAAPAPEPAPAAGLLDAETAWRDLPRYTYDQPRRLLRLLEREIQRAALDPARRRATADRLAAVLADPRATLDAKRFACRWLALVAEEAHVPILARLLERGETAEMAREALAVVPVEAAGKVLREALARAEKPEEVVGLMNALGARRDAAAVGLIARHLGGADPAVVASAADALGCIGTVEAEAALARAARGAEGKRAELLRDARLRAAERLVRAGRTDAAERVYLDLLTPDLPARWFVAVLGGLARAAPATAAPRVVEALERGEDRVRAGAVQLVRTAPGGAVSLAVLDRLPRLSPEVRAAVLEALAERPDAGSSPLRDGLRAAARRLAEMGEAEAPDRIAAVRALARVGSSQDVGLLVRLAAQKGPVAEAARWSLSRLSAEGVRGHLEALALEGSSAERVAVVRALAERQDTAAEPLLLAVAEKGEPVVRAAALEALAVVGGSAAYGRLVGWLAEGKTGLDPAALEKAAAAVARRLAAIAAEKPPAPDLVAPLAEALRRAGAARRPALVRLLGVVGGGRALALLLTELDAGPPPVRDAAVRVLAAWRDPAAFESLVALAEKAREPTHRALAYRGALRLLGTMPAGEGRRRAVDRVRRLATTPERKKALLAALARTRDRTLLAVAEAYLDDPQVRAEAEAAVKKLRGGRAAARSGPPPMPKVDPARRAARIKALAAKAPKGFRLACYLDCGPEASASAGDGGAALRLAAGRPYVWPGSAVAGDPRWGAIAFDEREVVFEVSGLDPKRAYRLGFSWWDFDHQTRIQSVWAEPAAEGGAEPGKRVALVGRTALPSGARGEKPAEVTVALPARLTASGRLRVVFRNDGEPNAVVSEVWLYEGSGTGSPAEAADGKAASAPRGKASQERGDADAGGKVSASARVDRSAKAAPVRVLLVTGIDHPAHKWRETAPVLRRAIEADPRLAVDVVADPAWLETGGLAPYKAVVHHWMNWKAPSPGPKARERFVRFVREGGGLVLVHFACGAWQDWPEFVRIAGRVWDPKRRGHDPRGPFRVRIVDREHPITRGMSDFETVDELYTCLAGATPIHVLAEATSKVDHKTYPMAFVLTYGRGRVFHCVLGHDKRALEGPVAELYRRATAWVAGLDPAGK